MNNISDRIYISQPVDPEVEKRFSNSRYRESDIEYVRAELFDKLILVLKDIDAIISLSATRSRNDIRIKEVLNKVLIDE